MSAEPSAVSRDDVPGDDKDWTWVLDRPCPDCAFDARSVGLTDAGEVLRADAEVWRTVLGGLGPDAARRPRPDTWSPLEYACHVRDVHEVFDRRLVSMLEVDDPLFENWDQDATARERAYHRSDAATVAAELTRGAEVVAARYDAVPPHGADRPGRRSNGSRFTVLTLARYHLHDVVHHRWDVRAAATRAAYQLDAASYRAATSAPVAVLDPHYDAVAARLDPGASVLEIGSGGGRDALALEGRGLRVRRTDVTPAFVELLRAEGHAAEVLDPLVDDLLPVGAPPHDAVWAHASLIHVARADLATALTRLGGAVRPGGLLSLSMKDGDGEGWSTHGSITAPRSFTYWRRPALRAVLEASGWVVEDLTPGVGERGESWCTVLAYRGPT